MREPRPIPGARAPLLERLRGTSREPVAAPPRRVLDRAGLFEAVGEEISRLLNTRAPRPAVGRELWVLDYGVPDFGGLSPARVTDRLRYAAELARRLQAFEPRLSQIHIELEPAPNDQQRLTGSLRAQLRIGTVREPVTFPLEVRYASGAASHHAVAAEAEESA